MSLSSVSSYSYTVIPNKIVQSLVVLPTECILCDVATWQRPHVQPGHSPWHTDHTCSVSAPYLMYICLALPCHAMYMCMWQVSHTHTYTYAHAPNT